MPAWASWPAFLPRRRRWWAGLVLLWATAYVVLILRLHHPAAAGSVSSADGGADTEAAGRAASRLPAWRQHTLRGGSGGAAGGGAAAREPVTPSRWRGCRAAPAAGGDWDATVCEGTELWLVRGGAKLVTVIADDGEPDGDVVGLGAAAPAVARLTAAVDTTGVAALCPDWTTLAAAVVWAVADDSELALDEVWAFLVALAGLRGTATVDVVVWLPPRVPAQRVADLQLWLAAARPEVALYLVDRAAGKGWWGCYRLRRVRVVTLARPAPGGAPPSAAGAAAPAPAALLRWPTELLQAVADGLPTASGAEAAAGPVRVLYLRGPRNRLANENALIAQLADALASADVVEVDTAEILVLDPATASLADAVEAARFASAVVSIHQPAALPALAAGVRPGSPVIELFSWHEFSVGHAEAAKALGLTYDWLPGAPEAAYGSPAWAAPAPVTDAASAAAWTRYQSTAVAWTPHTVEALARRALRSAGRPTLAAAAEPAERFLLFMPWEQLNNQLIGFRCACAIAEILNRTLVLPYLGYPKAGAAASADRWNFDFDVGAYAWEPMELYYDAAALADGLPCRTVTYHAYTVLARGRPAPLYLHNPLFQHTTSQQLVAYYSDVLALPQPAALVQTERLYRLPRHKVASLYGPLPDATLAFGTMFWMHDFGLPESQLRYPYREYVDLVAASPLYAQIARALRPRADLVDAGRALADALRQGAGGHRGRGRVIAVHVRGGPDYAVKCDKLDDPTLRARCRPDAAAIVAAILRAAAALDDGGDHEWTVYLSSDLNRATAPLLQAVADARELHGRGVATWADLAPARAGVERPRWSPLDTILTEQQLCAHADVFIGNIFSSYSRTIFDERAVARRTNHYL